MTLTAGWVSAVAAVLTFLATLVILAVYRQQRDIFSQQRDMAKHTNSLQMCLYMQSEPERQARKINRGFRLVEPTAKHDAQHRVAATLGLAASLARDSVIDEEVLINVWGISILKNFDALPPELKEGQPQWEALYDLIRRLRARYPQASSSSKY